MASADFHQSLEEQNAELLRRLAALEARQNSREAERDAAVAKRDAVTSRLDKPKSAYDRILEQYALLRRRVFMAKAERVDSRQLDDMDRRLLERTVEVAREVGGFDTKKIGKMKIAVDSRPLVGAGRMQDTINLLASCAGQLLEVAADMVGRDVEELAEELNLITIAVTGVKAALDVDWSDPAAKAAALKRVVLETAAVQLWVEKELPESSKKPPLSDILATLKRLREQNLEPDPSSEGARIKDGVAPDRQVSLGDPEMRHGRKSKSKAFNGYKSHLAVSLDERLVLACAVTPANEAEAGAMPSIHSNVADEWHFDLGYISASTLCKQCGDRVQAVATTRR